MLNGATCVGTVDGLEQLHSSATVGARYRGWTIPNDRIDEVLDGQPVVANDRIIVDEFCTIEAIELVDPVLLTGNRPSICERRFDSLRHAGHEHGAAIGLHAH